MEREDFDAAVEQCFARVSSVVTGRASDTSSINVRPTLCLTIWYSLR